MKKYISEFVHRGLLAAWCGSVILAIIYGVHGAIDDTNLPTYGEVCTGILSLTLMAFIAGGISMVYTVERLPLISAILIHGGVLYLDYLMIYLLNGWMPRNMKALGIFTAVFIVGFALIWLCIYLSIRKKTENINKKLTG